MEGILMQISEMETEGGYQVSITDDVYVFFDEVVDFGSNIMFKRDDVPTAGLYPPLSIEFMELWGKL